MPGEVQKMIPFVSPPDNKGGRRPKGDSPGPKSKVMFQINSEIYPSPKNRGVAHLIRHRFRENQQ